MKADFKAGDLVAIDPYNVLNTDADIFSSITGVVLEKHYAKSDVISMQTMDVLSVPNKHLYKVSAVDDVNMENIRVKRSSNPIFSIEELHLLKIIKEFKDLNITESEALDHIISKVESNILSEEIYKVIESKESSIDYPKVNTIMQYNIKEDDNENLKDSIKMGIHLNIIRDILDQEVYDLHYTKTKENCYNLIIEMFDKFGESLDTAKVIANTLIVATIEEDALSDLVIDNLISIYDYLDKKCDNNVKDEFLEYLVNMETLPLPLRMKLHTIITTKQYGDFLDEELYDDDYPEIGY